MDVNMINIECDDNELSNVTGGTNNTPVYYVCKCGLKFNNRPALLKHIEDMTALMDGRPHGEDFACYLESQKM